MNNFEKRMYLNYLDKLVNCLSIKSFEFDEVLDTFINVFHIKRNFFKFDEDNVVLTETRAQQGSLFYLGRSKDSVGEQKNST